MIDINKSQNTAPIALKPTVEFRQPCANASCHGCLVTQNPVVFYVYAHLQHLLRKNDGTQLYTLFLKHMHKWTQKAHKRTQND